MKKFSFAFLGASFAIAGCGGGSDGQLVSFEAAPIKVFSDNSGVGKLRGTSQGEVETGYIISPELALVLEELRNTQEVQPFDFASLSIVGSGPNTLILGGAIEEEGVVLNVLAAVTLDEDAALALIEEPIFGDSILITSGFEATNLPSSSTAFYSGTFGMQYFSAADPEIGAFTATANFDNPIPTVSFDGSTTTFTASGTALVSGNSFSSTTMTIGDARFISDVSGSMNGDFHGDGGNSIAGVIYSNDSFGDYRGGFVGSQ